MDHGGMNDVTKHTKTVIHQASIKSQKSTPAATNFFMKSKLDQDEDVTRAEVLFANFVAELNSAFCAAIPYYLLFVEILKIDINIWK